MLKEGEGNAMIKSMPKMQKVRQNEQIFKETKHQSSLEEKKYIQDYTFRNRFYALLQGKFV